MADWISKLPDRVGVIGGGRMGAGIAHAFLVKGAHAVIIEADNVRAEAARERVAGTLAKASERGVLDAPVDELLAHLHTSADDSAVSECALIVEAVPEDLDLKKRVIARIQKAAPDAALATNTSSLSIDAIARAAHEPERVIGLHFFNPVPASQLVEIVVGRSTAPGLASAAASWIEALGKTAITVSDSPGFASSRLGVGLALEAMRMLESGVASAADIDTAMTLGYKHPTGPLRTTDIVGLDVRLAIAEHLHRELGPVFEPPSILRGLVAAGHLGRKTGRGFYDWT